MDANPLAAASRAARLGKTTAEREPTAQRIPIRLRTMDPGKDRPGPGAGLHAEPPLAALADPWPDRPHREGYGWPVWIPATSRRAQISGSFALNLPTVPGEPHLGDWHKDGTW